jgi:dipeptide/tripeptide permease
MVYTLVLWLSVDFGYDDQGAAGWVTVFSSCATLFMLVAGFAGDALGLRRAMVVSFGLLAIGRLLMGCAFTRSMAIVGLMVMCVGYASCAPVVNTAFRRFSHPRARPFAFSAFYLANNVGAAGAGFLVDACRKPFLSADGKTLAPRVVHLGAMGDHPLSAYRTVFLAGAGLAAVSFALTLLLRADIDTERAAGSPPVPKAEPPWKIAAEVMREDRFWRFMLLMGLLAAVKMIFQHGNFTLPKYAIRELGEDFPIGTIQSINPIAILFIVPIATAITRHMAPFPVILAGSVVSAASVFVLVLPASFGTITAFFLILSVGEALWSPRSYEFVAMMAPRGRESSYMGLSGLPFFLAKLGALPMSGWLLATYCPEKGARHSSTMWLVIGLTTAAAPVLMFALRGVIHPGIGPRAEAPPPWPPAP